MGALQMFYDDDDDDDDVHVLSDNVANTLQGRFLHRLRGVSLEW